MNSGDNDDFHMGDGANAHYASPRQPGQFSRRQTGVCTPNGVSADFDAYFPPTQLENDSGPFVYEEQFVYNQLDVLAPQGAASDDPFTVQTRVDGKNSRPPSPAWPLAGWNMPGGFEPLPEDAMDVDSAMSFGPRGYYDQTPSFLEENGPLTHALDFLLPHAYERFSYSVANDHDESPAVKYPSGTQFGQMYVLQQQNPTVDPTGSYIPADMRTQDSPDSAAGDNPSLYRSASDFSAFDTALYVPHSTSCTPNMYLGGPEDTKDTASHRTSILAALNELLPLTTTTSFTPSATSLYLTQPSFFLAQQFLRSLIDQPPLLLTRASMDFYQRRRPSLESVNSGPNVPVRPQRSLASYFHFRDRDRDRDRERGRKLPMLRGGSPALPEWAQSQASRHSIRSIFKTSNGPMQLGDMEADQVDNEANETVPPSFMNHPEDEQTYTYPYGDTDESVAKKPKRSKRNLFTRFKPTKSYDPGELKAELNDDSDGEGADEAEPSNISLGAPAKAMATALHHVDSAGLATGGDGGREPDYAALFTGVGKRRNLVGKKSKKKGDVAIKIEPDIKIETEGDRVALNPSVSNNENSGDCVLASSVARSLASFNSKDSGLYEQLQGSLGPLAFANASKRILGSRLMKKKPAVSKSETGPSDVVEVDLQSLDLPENTEILSNPKLLSKTRGRKEDKAADMVDQAKIFVCGYCDRRFKRQEHLKRHFRSLHTSEKPYDCPICLKKFSRTDNLNQHLKIHKQEEEEAAAAAAAAAATTA